MHLGLNGGKVIWSKRSLLRFTINHAAGLSYDENKMGILILNTATL